MKYSEQREIVAELRSLADFYERPKSIQLPCPTVSITEYPAVYGMVTTIREDGSETREYGVKVNESVDKLKKFVKVLGSCEKNYTDYNFEVIKKFGNHVKLRFIVTREAICRKVPTGETKVIPAMPATPERVQPVYEYVCEEVALLK